MAAGAADAESARRDIEAEGRQITLVQLDTAASDSAMPWRGNAAPRDTPDASVSVYGVFVPPSGSGLGYGFTLTDAMKRAEQVVIIGPGSSFAYDIGVFDEVIDNDGTRWKIVAVQKLKPADTDILYFLWVRQ